MRDIRDLNLKNKKYIIFDMDGTLIDSIGIWNRTDQYLIENLGHVKKSLREAQIERDNFLHENQDAENQYAMYCKFLSEKYNFLEKDENKLLDLRWKISNEILESEVDFKPYSVELIRKLKSLNYIVILATMTTNTQLDIYKYKNKRMISKLNIEKEFDYIIGIDQVKNKKPDPEIYLKILEHFNCKKEECIGFEDSLTGVMSIKAAGIECINIYDENADINREKINELTDYFINGFDEILKIIE